ncbi:MAG: hemerythrin domain-containing protein [Gemmatimonadetes bacterium]|nr:hemerythrin domain-containing protein [Gemmatimonadota bacterium]
MPDSILVRRLRSIAPPTVLLLLPGAVESPRERAPECGIPVDIPASVRAEHREIRQGVMRAIAEKGEIGVAARTLWTVLQPHFVREEQIALPLLGALRPLSQGKPIADLVEVLPLADSLKRELPQMLAEHDIIARAVDRLAVVADRENKVGYQRFAERLKLHALNEEEVMYPAAIIAGDLMRLRAKVEGVTVPCVLIGSR